MNCEYSELNAPVPQLKANLRSVTHGSTCELHSDIPTASRTEDSCHKAEQRKFSRHKDSMYVKPPFWRETVLDLQLQEFWNWFDPTAWYPLG